MALNVKQKYPGTQGGAAQLYASDTRLSLRRREQVFTRLSKSYKENMDISSSSSSSDEEIIVLLNEERRRFNQVLLTKLSKLLVHCAIICARTEMTRIMPQRMTMIVSKHYKALNIVRGSGHLWRHKMSENCTKSISTHQQEKLLGSMTM